MDQLNESNRPLGEKDHDEEEIDLLELARKLWAGRRMVLRWAAVGAVVGLIVAFSIPREYTTTVKLAPEVNGQRSASGGLGALAAMAGVNIGGGASGADAVYPSLYPDIVTSVPFAVKLFDVDVTEKDGELTTTVSDYLTNHTSAPWWSAVMSLPGKAVGGVMGLFRGDSDEAASDSIDPFCLTPEENAVVEALRGRVGVDVDTKTSVITLSVTMQDPLVSAMLTDTVMQNLKDFVTEYRTNKARQDLEYTQRLHDEARDAYYEAQQRYARYMDANQSIVLRSVRTEQERLQNEMNLAYNLYNQMAQQLQLDKAKVQQSTPVFAVVQPATVPLRPSKPSKMLILVGMVFLAVVASSAWILFGRDIVASFRHPAE